MVKIVAVMLVGLWLWAGNAFAQDTKDALGEVMARDPDRFQADMVDLIAGFGQAGALTLDGIEEYIALTRAGARATALRRFMAQDLDGDGTVLRRELGVAQAAATAASRGRMERQFIAADANADDKIDAGELVLEGQGAALRALDEDEAAVLRAVLSLDTSGDGAVTVAELSAAVLRVTATP